MKKILKERYFWGGLGLRLPIYIGMYVLAANAELNNGFLEIIVSLAVLACIGEFFVFIDTVVDSIKLKECMEKLKRKRGVLTKEDLDYMRKKAEEIDFNAIEEEYKRYGKKRK